MTEPKMDEAAIAALFDEMAASHAGNTFPFSYRVWGALPEHLCGHFRRIANTGFAAGRASVDVAAERHAAARDALTRFATESGSGGPIFPIYIGDKAVWASAFGHALRFRDREYPAPHPAPHPAPPPSVTLSDGSVVTREGYAWARTFAGGRNQVNSLWPCTLLPSDTGADFDALKAFAAAQERTG